MTSATSVNKENARLRIFKGRSDKKLGITPDMEIGHLYHYNNEREELSEFGKLIGLSPSWMQNRWEGLAHYDLWGAPLIKARKLFKVVTIEEVYQDMGRLGEEVEEYNKQIERGALADYRRDDLVLTNIGFVSFASKSKGRSRGRGKPRGKMRLRRVWKDIELYRVCGTGWHTEKCVRFDEQAREITKSRMSGDELMWWVKEHCDRRGGKNKGIC